MTGTTYNTQQTVLTESVRNVFFLTLLFVLCHFLKVSTNNYMANPCVTHSLNSEEEAVSPKLS